jgi:hypothetical protein
MPIVSPQNYKQNYNNVTNDAGNSSIGGGPNPFATQNQIALHQIQSSASNSKSQSQNRVYKPPAEDRGHIDNDGNYIPWTGRNHYQQDQEVEDEDSPNPVEDRSRYFNG